MDEVIRSSGPAVVLDSTSPSYVGESTPSSEDKIEATSACRVLIGAEGAGWGRIVEFWGGRGGAEGLREEAEVATDTVDAASSVRGSLSSSEAS